MLNIQRNHGFVLEASWRDKDSVHIVLDGVEMRFSDIDFKKQSHPAIPPKASLVDGVEISDATSKGRGVTITVDKKVATVTAEGDMIVLASEPDPEYKQPKKGTGLGATRQSIYRDKIAEMEQSLRDDAWLKRND